MTPLFYIIPSRPNALHFVYDQPRIKPFLNFFQGLMGRNIRIRFRSHTGSFVEMKYALLTYGIHGMNIGADDEFRRRVQLPVIQAQRALETEYKLQEELTSSNNPMISSPAPFDVLLGKWVANSSLVKPSVTSRL